MAHLILTSVGSTGDLYPFLALGDALRTQGHQVTFAIEQRFAERVHGAGFDAKILDGDIVGDFIDYPPVQRLTFSPALSIQLLLEHYLLPNLPKVNDQLYEICQGADALISSNVQLAGPIAADRLGLPLISVTLTPASIPSRHIAPYPYRWPTRGRLFELINQIGWGLGRLAVRRYADPPINLVRTVWGLPPIRDVMFTGGLSPQLTAVAVSPALLPEMDDWPSHVRATGFCFWDEPRWTEPETLTRFWEDSRPVVAVSLGSITPVTGALYAPLFQACVQAIREAGARALVIGAPEGSLDELHPEVLAISYAPHAQVFPRCALIIHHGGMGTAAQAWRAGVPSLVMPGGVDQFVTAGLVLQCGVGDWVSRRRLDTARLKPLVQRLLSDRRVHEQARDLGERIRAEEGAKTLALAIERQLAHP